MNYTNSGLIRDQLDDIGRTTIFAEILLLDDLHWDPATLSDLHWDPATLWSSLRSWYSTIFTEILLLYDLHWDPATLRSIFQDQLLVSTKWRIVPVTSPHWWYSSTDSDPSPIADLSASLTVPSLSPACSTLIAVLQPETDRLANPDNPYQVQMFLVFTRVIRIFSL